MQDEHGTPIDTARVEGDEQIIARYCIEKGARVLELGARYGSVTYQIAQHASHVVAVEPDATVWGALENNLGMLLLKNVTLFKGFMSKTAQELIDQKNGYAKWSENNPDSKSKLYTLEEAETIANGKIDTLVADCEGCLPTFLQENPEVLSSLRTVIYEADRSDSVDYRYVESKLELNGFIHSLKGFQNVWVRGRRLSYISWMALLFTSQNKYKLYILLGVLVACIGCYYYYNK